jgi:hypothetical protein
MPPYSSPLVGIARDLRRHEGGQSVTERNVEGTAQNDHGRGDALEAERVAALAKLFAADAPPGLDDIAAPMYWPDLSPGEADQEWDALRSWVEQLVVRFVHLDHHVIPRCWFRHNGHVEALVALRDQERVNYSDTAPGSAAVEWHRALRDIEARLREWTSQLACGATHEVPAHQVRSLDSDEWDQFVNEDVNSRDSQAVASTLAE